MPHSPYCPICFSTFKAATKCIALPCECICCHSCLNDWLALKIREPSFSPKKTIPCFSQHCSETFQIQTVYNRLPKTVREQIDQELLNSYLIKTPDIRKCPNVRCSYAGIIDTSAKCLQPLECQACSTTWRDPLHFSSTEKLMAVATKSQTKRNEAFSSLWKKVWTKRCPNCQVPIEKTGGCFHMSCSHCNTSFCWTCSGRHNNLSHVLNSFIYCIPFVTILILAFYAIYQISVMYSAVDVLMNNFVRPLIGWCCYFAWVLSVFLLCAILVNTAFVLGYFLQQTFTKGPQKTQFRPLELLGMMIVICGFSYYFSYPKIILMIGLAEIPIILIALLIGKRNREKNNKVHKNDYRAHGAKKQVYKADFPSDSRKQYWTEKSYAKKSMKKVAYKFPSYRH